MSTAELTLLFPGIERTGADRSALRILLLPGEAYRVANARAAIRVISGNAWITLEGRDIILSTGGLFEVVRPKDPPVISGVGTEALLFEVR